MEEIPIIELFWERNEDAIAKAKKEYGSYIFYIANNLLHNEQDTEECLNDVLLAAWNSIPPHHPSNLKTYLGKLTREIAIDCLRKRSAQKRVSVEAAISFEELEEVIGEDDIERSVQISELSRYLSAFLRTLREDERNIFIRKYWYFDSVKNICARYGFGQSKVLVTLKRTREKLAKYLKKEGYLI